MNSERLATAALLLTMLAVGAVAWWLQLRPEMQVDAARLQELPLELGEWRGESLPLDSGVERMLAADLNVQRAYRRPGSEVPVWLYVGYYGTEGGGRPEHTPEVCYPSAGWQVESHERPAPDPELGALNELVVSRDGSRRLVHFWYRSGRSPSLLGVWDISRDHLRGRLGDGRADGALVRLSTPLRDGNLDAARERLVAFRRPLEPELITRWPEERPR